MDRRPETGIPNKKPRALRSSGEFGFERRERRGEALLRMRPPHREVRHEPTLGRRCAERPLRTLLEVAGRVVVSNRQVEDERGCHEGAGTPEHEVEGRRRGCRIAHSPRNLLVAGDVCGGERLDYAHVRGDALEPLGVEALAQEVGDPGRLAGSEHDDRAPAARLCAWGAQMEYPSSRPQAMMARAAGSSSEAGLRGRRRA